MIINMFVKLWREKQVLRYLFQYIIIITQRVLCYDKRSSAQAIFRKLISSDTLVDTLFQTVY